MYKRSSSRKSTRKGQAVYAGRFAGAFAGASRKMSVKRSRKAGVVEGGYGTQSGAGRNPWLLYLARFRADPKNAKMGYSPQEMVSLAAANYRSEGLKVGPPPRKTTRKYKPQVAFLTPLEQVKLGKLAAKEQEGKPLTMRQEDDMAYLHHKYNIYMAKHPRGPPKSKAKTDFVYRKKSRKTTGSVKRVRKAMTAPADAWPYDLPMYDVPVMEEEMKYPEEEEVGPSRYPAPYRFVPSEVSIGPLSGMPFELPERGSRFPTPVFRSLKSSYTQPSGLTPPRKRY